LVVNLVDVMNVVIIIVVVVGLKSIVNVVNVVYVVNVMNVVNIVNVVGVSSSEVEERVETGVFSLLSAVAECRRGRLRMSEVGIGKSPKERVEGRCWWRGRC